MKKFIKSIILICSAVFLLCVNNVYSSGHFVQAKANSNYTLAFYPDYQVIHGTYKADHNDKRDLAYVKFLVKRLRKRGYKFNQDFSEGKWHKHNLSLDKKERSRAPKPKIVEVASLDQKQQLIGKRVKTVPRSIRGDWGGPQSLQWRITKTRVKLLPKAKYIYKQKKQVYNIPTGKNSGFKFWVKKIKFHGKKYRVAVYQEYKFYQDAKTNRLLYRLKPKECYLEKAFISSSNIDKLWNKKKYPNFQMIYATVFQSNRHKLGLSKKDAINISGSWIFSY